MTDCVSNAAELVDKMRDYADTADDNIYGICVNTPNVLRQAATAIEALLAENAKLESKIDRLKAERDAAVADLKSIAPCKKCKHFGVNQMTCDALEKCLYGEEQAWEWRGTVKEEENATD